MRDTLTSEPTLKKKMQMAAVCVQDGLKLMKERNFEEACPHFEAALELAPGFPKAGAYLEQATKAFRKATSVATKASAKAPPPLTAVATTSGAGGSAAGASGSGAMTSKKALFNEGITLAKTGQYEAAIKNFNQLLSMGEALSSTDRLLCFYNRGLAKKLLTNEKATSEKPPTKAEIDKGFNEAFEDLDRTIKGGGFPDPKKQALVFHHRATMHWILERFEEALTDFNQSISLNPTAQTYEERGALCYKLGTLAKPGETDKIGAIKWYQVALIDFNRAIKLKPTLPKRHRVRLGKKAALEKIKRLMRLMPTVTGKRKPSAAAEQVTSKRTRGKASEKEKVAGMEAVMAGLTTLGLTARAGAGGSGAAGGGSGDGCGSGAGEDAGIDVAMRR